MKAHAILPMLVVLAAAEIVTEDRFQRRRPTRLTVLRTLSARSSRRSKAMELSTRGKADTESGRVLPKSSARKKFRKSLHLYMSTSVEIFVRPATAQCKSKLESCATRATNKVHIDEQPVGESKKRSLTSF